MTRSKFNNIIYLLLSLMLISLYTSHTQAILSISEPIAFLLAIAGIFIYKDINIKDALKKILIKKDILTISLILFITWSLIVSIFLSYQPKLSAYRSFRDFRDPIVFTIISLTLIYTDNRYKNWLLNLMAAICAISIIILFTAILFKYQDIQNIARDYCGKHLIIISPFLMINILSRNKLKSFLSILLTGICLFVFFYQKSRGSTLSLLIEISIITLFYFYKAKANYKTKALQIGILAIAFALMGLGFLKTNTGVFTRIISQGTNSSGRDVIIKTRLPIFLKYGSITHGIGSDYGAYINFFNEHNAPRKFGGFDKKQNKFIYWRDEPQALQVFYESGIIGVSLYLLFLISFAIKLLISGIKPGDNSYIAIPIFTALIGDSFVKALFENTGISTPIFLCAIWLILDQVGKIKHKNLNMKDNISLKPNSQPTSSSQLK